MPGKRKKANGQQVLVVRINNEQEKVPERAAYKTDKNISAQAFEDTEFQQKCYNI